jgi:glucose/arabinose dehydrogenase
MPTISASRAWSLLALRTSMAPKRCCWKNATLITGLHDGRVIRTSLDGKVTTVLADTGGRPLGLARHPNGLLVIADAAKGLLSLDGQVA